MHNCCCHVTFVAFSCSRFRSLNVWTRMPFWWSEWKMHCELGNTLQLIQWKPSSKWLGLGLNIFFCNLIWNCFLAKKLKQQQICCGCSLILNCFVHILTRTSNKRRSLTIWCASKFFLCLCWMFATVHFLVQLAFCCCPSSWNKKTIDNFHLSTMSLTREHDKLTCQTTCTTDGNKWKQNIKWHLENSLGLSAHSCMCACMCVDCPPVSRWWNVQSVLLLNGKAIHQRMNRKVVQEIGNLPVWQAGVNQQPSCSNSPTRVCS